MARFLSITLFILCGIFFGQSRADCGEKLKKCNKNFLSEMSTVKYHSAEKDPSGIYESVCSADGIYTRLVNCVRSLSSQCVLTPKSRDLVCMSRDIKMSTYRYTWRPNIVHDICNKTHQGLLDKDFFKHEKCMSKLLNLQQWKCDEHFKQVKSSSGNQSCIHWKEFRECSKAEVKAQCGAQAANVSDFLFNVHSEYFSTYRLCGLDGLSSTKCWYDEVLGIENTKSSKTAKTPETPATVTETFTNSLSSSPVPVTSESSTNPSTEPKSSQITGDEATVNDDASDTVHHDPSRQHDIRSAVPEQFQQDSKGHNASASLMMMMNFTWTFVLLIVCLLTNL